MLTTENFGAVEEIRKLLGNLAGVKSYTEILSLSYVLVVEKEEDKVGIAQVANALTEQATQYGIDLEIAAATEVELEAAKKQYEEYVNVKAKPKSSFTFDFSGKDES